jgi:hypothetical protein
MPLSPHRLRQIGDAYLRPLDREALRGLADLKEARARLEQQSADRSRPPNRPAPSEYRRHRAALAAVIETRRPRGHSPWRTLERASAARRAGQPRAA